MKFFQKTLFNFFVVISLVIIFVTPPAKYPNALDTIYCEANAIPKIHLIPDQYHLSNVGQLRNGNNYWIDIQLKSEGNRTRDFVATYIFDADGKLIDSNIIDLGLRTDENALSATTVIAEEKSRIGVINYESFLGEKKSFWVYPFSIFSHNLIFGLVVRKEDKDECGIVDAMPGYTIMFYPPWEDGAYDT